MNNRIFNVCADANACDCTQGCADRVGESALKVDSQRKIPCRTGESNLHQQRAGPTLHQLSYIPTPCWVDACKIQAHSFCLLSLENDLQRQIVLTSAVPLLRMNFVLMFVFDALTIQAHCLLHALSLEWSLTAGCFDVQDTADESLATLCSPSLENYL